MKLKILALETSTEFCSVALCEHDKTIHREVLAIRSHSEILLPMTTEILAEAEWTLQQLDGIAFGSGPGSFTGLRIACGVAQGLAYALDLPVVGISTLEATAERTDRDNVVVALDARMSEIYHAAYQRQNQIWKMISTPTLCSPLRAPSLLGKAWVACGSGFEKYQEELLSVYGDNLQEIRQGLHPHASSIAALAISRFNDGTATTPENAAPVYLRNQVALKENER